ncbi:MAG: hypothetical protein L6R37_001768 [Teloschistes peruensis]|nr:MAG: hypothetical protein L6R37_001768 [Teloschistes peruensis]
MASLRSMRSSRRSTPLSTLPQDAMLVKSEETSTRPAPASPSEWQEPPLRPPAPSFEDYKGLERHGVLEYMQPLGTLPTQRVKLRVKQHDHPRKGAPTKNGESSATGMEDLDTPDPAPPPSRRSESRKIEDRTLRASSSREKNEDSDYVPHVPNGMPNTTPMKAASSHSSQHGTPSSRVSHGRTKLKKAVEGAITQANEIADPALGLALQRLFDESFHDQHLSSLLESVLSQKPTPEQTAGFQSYMRQAQREIKRISGVSKHVQSPGTLSKFSSKSPSKDPHKATSTSKITSEVNGLKASDKTNPTSHPFSPAKTNANNMQSLSSLNASSLDHQPPTKRIRRSNSTSSLSSVASSLSSIDPNLARQAEEDFDGSSTPLPPLATTAKPKPKTSAGPRMGIFTATNKRSIAAANLNKEDEELASKRPKLQRTFDDYTVNHSDVRTHIPNLSSGTAIQVPSAPNVQRPSQTLSHLRNGVEVSAADDDSEISSPTTSLHSDSDLLIPPPPFAGSSRRGATPLSLGRPAKAGKKSARVKMS